MPAPMPTLFVSHGSPDFALSPGRTGRRLAALGRSLPRPAAILIVSAHWQSERAQVSTAERPETLHDFRGFNPALRLLGYPAPGHSELAERTVKQLVQAGWPATAHPSRGLDHGAWVPLLHLYPDASVPVFQVALPYDLDGPAAWRFGQALSGLREHDVLIMGSGSLTHSLRDFFQGRPDGERAALAFRDWIRETIRAQRMDDLVHALARAPAAERAHPTPEHFLPLIVAAGAAGPPLSGRIIEGDLLERVLAMDAVLFG